MSRIVSFNVNGIRAAYGKGLMEWFAKDAPDVLCLQETKAEPGQLSPELTETRDAKGNPYNIYWASAKKKGYSGVAIYSREKPLEVRPMGIADFDDEGRVLLAEYPSFSLINAYFPNSQDAGARLGYKLEFCAAMLELCDGIVSKGGHIVLCGDYNIAHTEIDLANPKQNEGNPGYLPEERAWMTKFLGAGYVDSFRHFVKEGGHYSWWSYRAIGARERNVGWRLDYHCVDSGLLLKIDSPQILTEVMGSDHCPVSIEIKDGASK